MLMVIFRVSLIRILLSIACSYPMTPITITVRPTERLTISLSERSTYNGDHCLDIHIFEGSKYGEIAPMEVRLTK